MMAQEAALREKENRKLRRLVAFNKTLFWRLGSLLYGTGSEESTEMGRAGVHLGL